MNDNAGGSAISHTLERIRPYVTTNISNRTNVLLRQSIGRGERARHFFLGGGQLSLWMCQYESARERGFGVTENATVEESSPMLSYTETYVKRLNAASK